MPSSARSACGGPGISGSDIVASQSCASAAWASSSAAGTLFHDYTVDEGGRPRR